jgi:hypothetical protein
MWFAVQQTPNHSTGTGGPAAMIFIDNKYTRWGYAIVERAQKRASTRKQAKELLEYIEQHHVIPKSFYLGNKHSTQGWLDGDPNSSSNLVYLTAKEHFICHLLLIRMTNGKAKMMMSFALRAMRSWRNKNHKRYKISSIWYELSKVTKISHSEESRKKISESGLGRVPWNKGSKGNIPWNKGKVGVSEETREKNE